MVGDAATLGVGSLLDGTHLKNCETKGCRNTSTSSNL